MSAPNKRQVILFSVLTLAIAGYFLIQLNPGLLGGGSQEPAAQPEAVTSGTPNSAPDSTPPAEGAASPSATTPPQGDTTMNTAQAPVDLNVDANGLSNATVVITTNKGVIKYKFYSKDAPNTVARMVELINQGFYNGLTFHRVEPNFVVQGGDPLGNGTGGSGRKLKAEFNKRKHVEGTVAMARAADPDSADSQFYITIGKYPHLDGNYTVFGQVIDGMGVVRSLQPGDKMTTLVIQ